LGTKTAKERSEFVKISLLVPAIAFLSACSGLASTARELEGPLLQQGHHELALNVSPDFEGAVGDMLFFEAGYGVFALDNLLVRGTASYTLIEDVAPPASDYRAIEFDLVGEYHIDFGSPLVPYLGADMGWRRIKFGAIHENGVVFGARGGLKYFLADNVALDFHVVYKGATRDVFINDYESEDTDLSSLLGLRVSF
jgi:opacity protein-like surface antigen